MLFENLMISCLKTISDLRFYKSGWLIWILCSAASPEPTLDLSQPEPNLDLSRPELPSTPEQPAEPTLQTSQPELPSTPEQPAEAALQTSQPELPSSYKQLEAALQTSQPELPSSYEQLEAALQTPQPELPSIPVQTIITKVLFEKICHTIERILPSILEIPKVIYPMRKHK